MSIAQLFTNLKNHTILRGNPSFSEDVDLELLASLDFGTRPEKRTCNKGYPCRKTCINKGYACKDPIEGQAKTYAEWLEVQAKAKKTVEPEIIKIKEPEPVQEIVVNLSNFESVKSLGERIAEKYIQKTDQQELDIATRLLAELEPKLNEVSEAVFAQNDAGIFEGKEYQQLQNTLNRLSDQHGALIIRLQAAQQSIPLDTYKIFKDKEAQYNIAKLTLERFDQGKSIAQKKLDEQELEDKKNELILDFIDKELKFYEIKNEITALSYRNFSDLKNDLIAAGGKSEADSDVWLNSFGKLTPKVKKSSQAFKDVYQLTGGNIPTLKSIRYDTPRAYALEDTGYINVGKSERASTIFHEVGHHLEYSYPDLKSSAKAFIQKRGAGQAQTLRKITGLNSYKKDEIAIPDNFVDPYVGKIYRKGSTEVISMGLERFSTPEAMKKFRDKDPEHFHYILGVLAHVNNLKP